MIVLTLHDQQSISTYGLCITVGRTAIIRPLQNTVPHVDRLRQTKALTTQSQKRQAHFPFTTASYQQKHTRQQIWFHHNVCIVLAHTKHVRVCVCVIKLCEKCNHHTSLILQYGWPSSASPPTTTSDPRTVCLCLGGGVFSVSQLRGGIPLYHIIPGG